MNQFKLYRWEDKHWVFWIGSPSDTYPIKVAERYKDKFKMELKNPQGKVICRWGPPEEESELERARR